MARALEVLVAPVTLRVDDARVEIFEVLKFDFPDGKPRYHVTCRIRWRDVTSRVFFLDVTDMKDLERKLKIELSKLKMLYLVGGKRLVTEVMGR